MAKRISAQTFSFVVLLLIIAVGSFAVTRLNKQQSQKTENSLSVEKKETPIQNKINKIAQKNEIDQNTENWKTYADNGFVFSFKYPPNWKVVAYDRQAHNVHIVVIDPGKEYPDHIRIYVTDKGYFAVDGLAREDARVAGLNGWTIQDMLMGVKTDNHYFTFDLGTNLSLRATFKTIVSTVAINK